MEATQEMLNAVKQVLFCMHFEDYEDKRKLVKGLDENVVFSKDDTGRWEPKSLITVYLEDGIGLNTFADNAFDWWVRVNDTLVYMGFPIFFEYINDAVGIFWPLHPDDKLGTVPDGYFDPISVKVAQLPSEEIDIPF